jgi:hypothetical protein
MACDFLLDDSLQRRQGPVNGIPDELCCDILVVVPIDIACGGYLLPSDRWMSRLDVSRDATRCLGNDFKAARGLDAVHTNDIARHGRFRGTSTKT